MPAAEDHLENSRRDGDEKRAEEEICGNGEDGATLPAAATQIEDGDDDENAHAEGNGMRQQGRNGRDQGADSRRNTHRRSENIVRHVSAARGKEVPRAGPRLKRATV